MEDRIQALFEDLRTGRTSRRDFIRGATMFGLSATVATLLAACGAQATQSTAGGAAKSGGTSGASTASAQAASKAAPTPVSGGTVTAATIDKPVNMDPAFAELYSSIQVYDNVFSKAVYADATGAYQPALAKSWRQINPTTWEFDLVDNAVFHNGEPFTSQDFVYTINRIQSPKLKAPNAVFISPIKGAEAVNKYTVRLTTEANWGGLIAALALFSEMVNQKAIESQDPKLHPVGCGPFKFTQWVQDDHITLDRWPQYYRKDRPYLSSVIFKAIADDQTRLVGLQKGELNWVEQIPLQLVDSMKTSTQIKYNTGKAYFPNLVMLNCTRPPFNDQRVRQAVAWAIDRTEITKLVYFGQSLPSAECMSPDSSWYTGINPYAGGPNVAKAKQLLKEAGYPNGISVVFAGQPQVATQIGTAQVLKNQFAKVGIKMTIQQYESARWFQALADKTYDLTSTYWSVTLDPEFAYYPLTYSTSGWNFAGFKSPEIDKALTAFRFTVDVAARKKAYANVVKVVAEQAPIIFTDNMVRTYWTSPNVYGAETLPSLDIRMERLWRA